MRKGRTKVTHESIRNTDEECHSCNDATSKDIFDHVGHGIVNNLKKKNDWMNEERNSQPLQLEVVEREERMRQKEKSLDDRNIPLVD